MFVSAANSVAGDSPRPSAVHEPLAQASTKIGLNSKPRSVQLVTEDDVDEGSDSDAETVPSGSPVSHFSKTRIPSPAPKPSPRPMRARQSKPTASSKTLDSTNRYTRKSTRTGARPAVRERIAVSKVIILGYI